MAETSTRRIIELGEEVTTPLEATFQSSSGTDDIAARLSPTIAEGRWVVRRRTRPLSMFRRSPSPHQEAWTAIEEALTDTSSSTAHRSQFQRRPVRSPTASRSDAAQTNGLPRQLGRQTVTARRDRPR